MLFSNEVSIGNEGAETVKAFTTSLVKSKKVTFRPGVNIKEMLNFLTFEKLQISTTKSPFVKSVRMCQKKAVQLFKKAVRLFSKS